MKQFWRNGILVLSLLFINIASAHAAPDTEVVVIRWTAQWCVFCPKQKQQVDGIVNFLQKSPQYKVTYTVYDLDDPKKPWLAVNQAPPPSVPAVKAWARLIYPDGTTSGWEPLVYIIGVIPQQTLGDLLLKILDYGY